MVERRVSLVYFHLFCFITEIYNYSKTEFKKIDGIKPNGRS